MDFLSGESVDWQTLTEQGIDLGLTLLSALAVLIVGLWLAGFVERRLSGLFGRSERIDPTVSAFLASLAKYAVVAFTGIALLDQFGVETTSLVALLGAAGLAVGLALQGTLSNLAAGVMLLLFRPFKVGDFVQVGGESGTAQSISLFTTQLDTPDNVRIIIPNGSIWGSSITNLSFHDTRRLELVFGVGYGAKIDEAIAIIRDIVAADSRCHADPEPFTAVTALGDSAVDITLRVWCARSDLWGLKCDLMQQVKEAFDANGIDIPYPTRTVINTSQ